MLCWHVSEGLERKTKLNIKKKSEKFVCLSFLWRSEAWKVKQRERERWGGRALWISERLNSHYARFEWTKMKIKSFSCFSLAGSRVYFSLIDKTGKLNSSKKKNASDFWRVRVAEKESWEQRWNGGKVEKIYTTNFPLFSKIFNFSTVCSSSSCEVELELSFKSNINPSKFNIVGCWDSMEEAEKWEIEL